MKLLPAFQNPSKYFLPYQIRWLDDDSPLKITEKSRQIVIQMMLLRLILLLRL